MLAQARNDILLLDTNIVIVYAREGEPSRRLEALINLQAGKVEALVSAVTVGEALSFALKSDWGARKRDKLAEILRTRVVPVDISLPEIQAAYARIDHHTERIQSPARRMGKNDLWIAATAHVLGCELVTTDGDFDHLDGVLLRRRKITPESLMPCSPPKQAPLT